MSYPFRGSRADIEAGFPFFANERPSVRIRGQRPINSNSLSFLVMVLLLFMVLNSHQTSSNFLATYKQLQAQARPHAAAASGLFGYSELRVHMPPPITFATRGRLQGLRLQLALLDREFDDLDYDALRTLDSEGISTNSMSEEEINALPVRKYKKTSLCVSGDSSQQKGSSSSNSPEVTMQERGVGDIGNKPLEDELTCSICLEQVSREELVRSLPCFHQFHANCIDPWLRQQGKCPVCKFKLGAAFPDTQDSESDAGSDMV
ncbi:hypothetical protein MLD38_025209 [Melastoma candidum]|uniref:Uncharacterized protein n=1 Tax=Melastoma candidum TaxID=119954 RepID=A0ACB9NUL5_9MYRT|nr:hypothetical protein MLD38_025209 [Melastoma candidum]